MASKPRTLYEKIWDQHVVDRLDDGTCLIYIDRHLVHEVTSPQAFEALRLAGRTVRRPDLTLAVPDHNLPTTKRIAADGSRLPIEDTQSAAQLAALERNAPSFGIDYIDATAPEQGIVHVVGPEQGFSLPGATIVCGDSHTAAHGGIGALAFGIGTSEVEHVLATQTLRQKMPKQYKVEFKGTIPAGVTAKDLVLELCGKIGTAGGTGCAFEFCGDAIKSLSMEGRLTICNMAIEAGARAGLIAPDQITIDYVTAEDRPFAPKGAELDQSIEYWKTLYSDEGAVYDKTLVIDVKTIVPQVTWGTSPGMVTGVTDTVPQLDAVPGYSPEDVRSALDYMGLEPGKKITDITIDTVFIGSCTNGRIEDLREAAKVMEGKQVADGIRVLVVPGSEKVRFQAEAEKLDAVFKAAGADWRFSGCSMCLAMNPDKLKDKERCASTSNRNFEGRQGRGGRTHLVSPAMAAAAAIAGKFVDVRELG